MQKYAILTAENTEIESKCKIIPLEQNTIFDCLQQLLDRGASYFLCSAKPGLEAQAALFLLRRKAEGFPIFLEFVIENELIFTSWTDAELSDFFHVGANCDKETLLAHRPTPNTRKAYLHYMEKTSDKVLLLPSPEV